MFIQTHIPKHKPIQPVAKLVNDNKVVVVKPQPKKVLMPVVEAQVSAATLWAADINRLMSQRGNINSLVAFAQMGGR